MGIDPPGGNLVTLPDPREHIAKLPKKEHVAPEWQAAIGSADPGGGDQ